MAIMRAPAEAEARELVTDQLEELARQAARSVLPNATQTKIFVTANARALRHFIEMRASEHAETEIRIFGLSKERKNRLPCLNWA